MGVDSERYMAVSNILRSVVKGCKGNAVPECGGIPPSSFVAVGEPAPHPEESPALSTAGYRPMGLRWVVYTVVGSLLGFTGPRL